MTKEQREKRVSDESIKQYFDKEEWELANLIDIEDIADDNTDPLKVICRNETKDARDELINELNERFDSRSLDILKLRYLDKKTYREIGEIHHLSGCRIGQIIQRAEKIFRNCKYRYDMRKRIKDAELD